MREKLLLCQDEETMFRKLLTNKCDLYKRGIFSPASVTIVHVCPPLRTFGLHYYRMLLVVLMGVAGVASAAVDDGPSPRMTLTDMASQIISRSATNSQVLSLNLTNLVILLLLKGLLYGATMWGGGHQQQGHGSYKGRSHDEDAGSMFSETEVMIFTTYLMGTTEDDFTCLYRVACQDPAKAKQYLAASKLLLKTAKTMKDVIPYDDKYENLIYNVQDAINFGTKYGTCGERFSCKRPET